MLTQIKQLSEQILLTDEARLVMLREQIVQAEAARAKAYDALGANLLNESPDEKVDNEYAAAVMRCEQLSAALGALEKRIAATAVRSKEEERAECRRRLDAALSDLQKKAQAVETALEAVERTTDACAQALDVAKAACAPFANTDEDVYGRLHYGASVFKHYLLHAASKMPACQVPYVPDMKPYSTHFPQPSKKA